MTRAHAPQRWSTCTPRPVGYWLADPNESLACAVLRRIIRNRQQTEAGSFLLACPETHAVYVLAEGSNNTQRLVRVRSAWWVGQYAQGPTPPRPNPFPFPTLADILDDLGEHFR